MVGVSEGGQQVVEAAGKLELVEQQLLDVRRLLRLLQLQLHAAVEVHPVRCRLQTVPRRAGRLALYSAGPRRRVSRKDGEPLGAGSDTRTPHRYHRTLDKQGVANN